MLLADAVLVRLAVAARTGADACLETAAAQNLTATHAYTTHIMRRRRRLAAVDISRPKLKPDLDEKSKINAKISTVVVKYLPRYFLLQVGVFFLFLWGLCESISLQAFFPP